MLRSDTTTVVSKKHALHSASCMPPISCAMLQSMMVRLLGFTGGGLSFLTRFPIPASPVASPCSFSMHLITVVTPVTSYSYRVVLTHCSYKGAVGGGGVEDELSAYADLRFSYLYLLKVSAFLAKYQAWSLTTRWFSCRLAS